MSKSTKPQRKDYRFCSQCKRSEYVKSARVLRLKCDAQKHTLDPASEIPANCPDFKPEKAEFRSRQDWNRQCNACGISIEERGEF